MIAKARKAASAFFAAALFGATLSLAVAPAEAGSKQPVKGPKITSMDLGSGR